MPLDPSIIMGYKPAEIENPVNALTRALQAKAAMGQADLQGLQIQQAKDSATRASNFRAALADQTLDLANPDAQRKLIGIDPEMGQKAISAYNDNLKTGADIKKSSAQAMEADAKANESKYNLTRTKWTKAVTDIASMGSREEAYKHLQAGIDSGDLTPDKAALIKQSIDAIPDGDVAAFATWKANTLRGLTSPDVLARLDQDKAEGAANRQNQKDITGMNNAVTMRGQDMTNDRQKEANATKSAEIKVNGGKGAFDAENTLRDEFNKQSGNYIGIRDAYGKVQAAAKNPTAAGDIALIYAYMKILDPTSVVREGEFATAQNAAGVPDKVRNMFNKTLNGERLQDDQRQDIVSQSGKIYTQQSDIQNKLTQRYTDMSKRYNLRPDNVVGDLSMPSQNGSQPSPRYSPAYQEYLDAYNSAKGNPQVQAAITARARQNGVVK